APRSTSRAGILTLLLRSHSRRQSSRSDVNANMSNSALPPFESPLPSPSCVVSFLCDYRVQLYCLVIVVEHGNLLVLDVLCNAKVDRVSNVVEGTEAAHIFAMDWLVAFSHGSKSHALLEPYQWPSCDDRTTRRANEETWRRLGHEQREASKVKRSDFIAPFDNEMEPRFAGHSQQRGRWFGRSVAALPPTFAATRDDGATSAAAWQAEKLLAFTNCRKEEVSQEQANPIKRQCRSTSVITGRFWALLHTRERATDLAVARSRVQEIVMRPQG
ncbi:uncharacterized protein IWZ02DRAFT_519923, partial [Phyllosticta citriasiana]|uniref:uncharacterized protein n=1 Tax=Phyllosticta citriasiana TaxID=595635 RepID=UPI0030FD96CD